MIIVLVLGFSKKKQSKEKKKEKEKKKKKNLVLSLGLEMTMEQTQSQRGGKRNITSQFSQSRVQHHLNLRLRGTIEQNLSSQIEISPSGTTRHLPEHLQGERMRKEKKKKKKKERKRM